MAHFRLQEIAYFRASFACKLYNMENARMRSQFAVLVPLILFGCALTPVKRPWKLELMTSGGFTGRGLGSITLDSAGPIELKMANGKRCTLSATEDELKRYDALLGHSDPHAWRDSYSPENKCCDRIEHHLRLSTEKKLYETEWISAPLPMPEDLVAISDALLQTLREHSCPSTE
jgi:hypothetical protein